MCMEDIRIGRETGSIYGKLQLADGIETAFLIPNTKRISFFVSADTQFPVFLEPRTRTQLPIGGFFLTITHPRQLFDLETCGNLIRDGWFATASGGAVTLAWIENTLERV